MPAFSASVIGEGMTLSSTDKIVIREITREMMASPEIAMLLEHIATEATTKATAKAIKNHQGMCPVKIKVDRVKWFALGVFAFGGVVGLVAAPAAIKILLVLLA